MNFFKMEKGYSFDFLDFFIFILELKSPQKIYFA